MKVSGVKIQPARELPTNEREVSEDTVGLGGFSLNRAKHTLPKDVLDFFSNLSNSESLQGNRTELFREFLISVYDLNRGTASTIAKSLNNILIDAAESGTDSGIASALQARNDFLAAAKDKERVLFGDTPEEQKADWFHGSPKKAPIEYRHRPNQAQKASEFLEDHYGPWLRGNGLYRPDLRKMDKSLVQGLVNEFRGRFDELAELLPTKRSEINALLGPDAESMSTAERKRALDSLRVRLD